MKLNNTYLIGSLFGVFFRRLAALAMIVISLQRLRCSKFHEHINHDELISYRL